MVPDKRKLMVVSGAIAAALALPGCAPAGYNAADYGTGAGAAAEPAANAVTASPTASPNPEATPNPASTEGPGADADKPVTAPELSDKDLTTELHGTTVKRMGAVVKDQNGWVLYRFDNDKSKPPKSNCNDECEKVWPPALTKGDPELTGLSADDVGTVVRADGAKQLTLKGWPLYRYIGDEKKGPGSWSGQNVSGKWFVIRPDGGKNLTCLPKISKPVAPPKDDNESNKGQESSSDTGSSGSDYAY